MHYGSQLAFADKVGFDSAFSGFLIARNVYYSLNMQMHLQCVITEFSKGATCFKQGFCFTRIPSLCSPTQSHSLIPQT